MTNRSIFSMIQKPIFNVKTTFRNVPRFLCYMSYILVSYLTARSLSLASCPTSVPLNSSMYPKSSKNDYSRKKMKIIKIHADLIFFSFFFFLFARNAYILVYWSICISYSLLKHSMSFFPLINIIRK